MKTILDIRNENACGCPNALHRALAGLQGIFGVRVDTGRGTVEVEHTDEVTPHQIAGRLREAGYRVENLPEGIGNAPADSVRNG